MAYEPYNIGAKISKSMSKKNTQTRTKNINTSFLLCQQEFSPSTTTATRLLDQHFWNARAKTPTGYNSPYKTMMSKTRARHETISCRFRDFKSLSTKFQNMLSKQLMCFHSIVNMVHLKFKQEAQPSR
jgi:hypothetical protein